MTNKWAAGGFGAALGLGLGFAGPAGAAAATAGVLDRLTVSSAPVADGTADRPSQPSLTADPVAVPTPTAGESGLAVMAGLVTWRVARRAVRRAGFAVSGR